MIKDDMTPYRFRVRFEDNGVERTHYTDDRRYFEQLVATHGHLSGLRIDPLTLTAEQQQRLDDIKSVGLTGHDAGVYVQHGTTESEDTGYYDAAKIDAYHRSMVEPSVRYQRKMAEEAGVAINGVRYAGDAGNRQALQEAILAADDGGMTVFAAWKDSDNQYHVNHPVSAVKDALRKIGQRRSTLIALEALYVAQVADGTADLASLDWTTEYD